MNKVLAVDIWRRIFRQQQYVEAVPFRLSAIGEQHPISRDDQRIKYLLLKAHFPLWDKRRHIAIRDKILRRHIAMGVAALTVGRNVKSSGWVEMPFVDGGLINVLDE